MAAARAERRTRRALPPVPADLDREALRHLAFQHRGPVADAMLRALRREGER
jgi:hypothetical protein